MVLRARGRARSSANRRDAPARWVAAERGLQMQRLAGVLAVRLVLEFIDGVQHRLCTGGAYRELLDRNLCLEIAHRPEELIPAALLLCGKSRIDAADLRDTA